MRSLHMWGSVLEFHSVWILFSVLGFLSASSLFLILVCFVSFSVFSVHLARFIRFTRLTRFSSFGSLGFHSRIHDTHSCTYVSFCASLLGNDDRALWILGSGNTLFYFIFYSISFPSSSTSTSTLTSTSTWNTSI